MPERVAALRRPTRVDLASRDVHALVPALAPEVLHKLIRHRGPEACASLLVAMTPQQLEAVLDLDLWAAPRAGVDETFDAGRFGEWLESLADAGEAVAAEVIGRMDVPLVSAGLSQFIRVRDQASIGGATSDDEIMFDERDVDCPSCEIGGYLISGLGNAGWDAIVSVLVALDTEAPERFHAVMRSCRELSNGPRELDGLDDLLAESEQRLHELRLARERRHEASGHTSAADARAFLQMARRPRPAAGRAGASNPLYAAHVRDCETILAGQASHRPLLASSSDAGVTFDPILLRDLLAEVAPDPGERLQLGDGTELPTYVPRMRTLLDTACDLSIEAGLARHRELAFLANVLVSGGSVQARAFTPGEAMTAVLAVSHLGLDYWAETAGGDSTGVECPSAGTCPDNWLVAHDLISAFEVGWAVMHEQVGMATARHLRQLVDTMRCTDPWVADGLGALSRALRTHCEARTPWGAREALEVVALLDLPAWTSLLGLLDECPVIPNALPAIIGRTAWRVSATSFEFISSRSQVEDVRTFLSRLEALLT